MIDWKRVEEIEARFVWHPGDCKASMCEDRRFLITCLREVDAECSRLRAALERSAAVLAAASNTNAPAKTSTGA